MNQMNEIQSMLANENLCLSDRLLRYQIEHDHLQVQNKRLKDAFMELLENFERFRNSNRVLFDTDSRYYWIEKAGLLEQHDQSNRP
jgi:archaellum biogenesis ATPase FlaH